MQMERMTTLSQRMCSQRSMRDAAMAGSAAVNKRPFHSSLGPATASAATCRHMPSFLVAQGSDVHRLSPADAFTVRVITGEIVFSGAAAKSHTVRVSDAKTAASRRSPGSGVGTESC